jgi:large subunit ribosomal protein L19
MAETAKKDTKESRAKKAPAKLTKAVIPQLAPGDTVKVTSRIIEGDKERQQVFQGVVIKIKEGADGGSFTVRRVAYGVGVERTFPKSSPMLAKVELVRHGQVRRARLFYLRQLSGKAARIKEKRLSKEKLAMIEAAGASVEEEPPVEAAEAAPEATAPETPPQS